MSDTFTLNIELGNEAMQTRTDVAEALHNLANEIRRFDTFQDGDSGNIRDGWGNTVGRWTFTGTEDVAAYQDDDQRFGGYDNPYEGQ